MQYVALVGPGEIVSASDFYSASIGEPDAVDAASVKVGRSECLDPDRAGSLEAEFTQFVLAYRI